MTWNSGAAKCEELMGRGVGQQSAVPSIAGEGASMSGEG
jgi:hypothetical protein